MINDSRLTPLIRSSLKNGDKISIPSTKHTYVWIYQIPEEEVIEDGAISIGKHRCLIKYTNTKGRLTYLGISHYVEIGHLYFLF